MLDIKRISNEIISLHLCRADLANLVNEAALLAGRSYKSVVEKVDFIQAVERSIAVATNPLHPKNICLLKIVNLTNIKISFQGIDIWLSSKSYESDLGQAIFSSGFQPQLLPATLYYFEAIRALVLLCLERKRMRVISI